MVGGGGKIARMKNFTTSHCEFNYIVRELQCVLYMKLLTPVAAQSTLENFYERFFMHERIFI
jgi:hypothetical protein